MKRGRAARTRATLLRTARYARSQGLVRSRAERFAARLNGAAADATPRLSEVARWPAWPASDVSDQHRVFALTALLSARDALGQVISGNALRLYAASVGDDVFERALALGGSGTCTLPSPQDLTGEGERLALHGLPQPLARSLGQSPAGDAEAARHVAEAEGLLRL
ncbi:hypothetical protein [Novosphingobium gossypii]|uniref:hypothetical protein n=1 Tax=Novosphingobium gossypii TaxID=1604774 RepID=UPI003D244109